METKTDWPTCSRCGEPARGQWNTLCEAHGPKPLKRTPLYMWAVYLPLAALAVFLILAFMGLMGRTNPY